MQPRADDATVSDAMQPVAVGDLLGGLAEPVADEVEPVSVGAPAGSGSNGHAPTPQDAPVGGRVPPAFSAKGLDGPASRRLHYSAPADDGSLEERDVAEDGADGGGLNGTGATRADSRPQRRSSKKARRRGK